MLLTALCVVAWAVATESTHIFTLDRDFNRLNSDTELSESVSEILARLKTFKIPIHPRVRLFYRLLRRGMERHSQRVADSLYVPDKYNVKNS
ncbi:hypothetical protein MSG28_015701 [Choristoneura fumiferana]|uniref:Uncharacterized protein n=1 Tax=Choristoneura fumiferana TaxID=7141 RepID=A0ACC0KB20_CHOFU|nr:hypothetical protein MSG28_015701 [Choristoneura fumiferana]